MGLEQGRRLLLVGAYERDNFGDILFAILTRGRLRARGHFPVLSSPVHSDMRHIFGDFVHAYDGLLQSFTWDALWVAGGEIGGAGVLEAAGMALEPSTSRIYKGATVPGAIDRLREQLGAPDNEQLAYLPDLSCYYPNESAGLVVNSVGGFRDNGRASYLKARGGPSVISCRDQLSYEATGALVPSSNRLAPDIVHSMPDDYSFEPAEERYLLFQVSEAIAKDCDFEALGDALAQMAVEHDWELYLFPAGEAPGHDSREVYREVQKAVEVHNRSVKVERISERDPVALAGWIAGAQAWIGSSLHGRIISAAYGVPRVSLDKPKVNEYSQEWDAQMPHSVGLGEIDQALRQALALKPEDNRGDELRKLARDNFNELAEIMETWPLRTAGPIPTEAELAYETLNQLRRRAESDFRRSSSF